MLEGGSQEPGPGQWFLENASPERVPCEGNRVGPIALIHNGNLDSHLPLAETLRQFILTKVPGWAITKVKLGYKREPRSPTIPVLHKHSYIPGVVENVREILSNLQRGVFRLPDNESSRTLFAEISSDIPISSHYKELLLGDLFEEDEFSVVLNPDQRVLTFQDTGFSLTFEFTIEQGTGYRKAEKLTGDEPMARAKESLFLLNLDSNFNPVTCVGYNVQPGRLYFDISTNGARTPLEAYRAGYEIFKTRWTPEGE